MGKYIISFLLTLLAAGQSFAWSGTGSAFLPEADSLFTAVDTSSGDLHIKKKFLPVSRRIDRGINDITYVYKNEIALGLDVSYGTLSSDDTNIMLMIDGLDFKGSVFTVNPSVGYFFTDNICVGTRFGYSKIDGNLGNVTLDIGMDDLLAGKNPLIAPESHMDGLMPVTPAGKSLHNLLLFYVLLDEGEWNGD